MSTYNGEKYLSEQINSLMTQKGVNVHLQIRDDGSSDYTIKILEQFKTAFPDKIDIELGTHKGFSESFYLLAASADAYDYYAFCDQDDVWMPGKLQTAVDMIDGTSDVPEMYFSNVQLTDSILRPLHTLYKDYHFPSLLSMRLTDNPAPGCSIVFNNTARKYFIRADKDKIVYHDFWMYLICSYMGKVVYDSNCQIMYRQHDSNVMGLHNQKKNWIGRIRKLNHKLHIREYAAAELCRLFSSQINPAELDKVRIMSEYRKNLSAKMRLFFHREIVAPDPVKNFWFKLQVLLGSA